MTTLKELRRRTLKNLQILKGRKAKQGNNAELRLLNEIEDHETALALIDEALASEQTEKDLQNLKEALRPLLVATNVEGLSVDELEREIPPLEFEPETILIPAGPFLMGAATEADVLPKEKPQHQVNLDAYQIGEYPVTNDQYAEFIKQNPQHKIPKRAGWFVREPPEDKLDHPVVGVDWYDAVAYCQWLSQKTKRTYRLPTEAEWEKAASWVEDLESDPLGGYKQTYPWGDEWHDDHCNTSNSQTTPVNHYPQGISPYGCYDMLGNVQEWTNTLWGSNLHQSDFPYPYQADDGREDPKADERLHRVYRIHRGGPPNNIRCTARGASDPDSKIKWRGFRVVSDI